MKPSIARLQKGCKSLLEPTQLLHLVNNNYIKKAENFVSASLISYLPQRESTPAIEIQTLAKTS